MISSGRFLHLAILLALAGAACAPAPRAAPGSQAGAPADDSSGRTLSVAIRVEPASLAAKSLQQGAVTLTTTRRIFNAALTLIDGTGALVPYLASEVPQLNTDTWRVFPDGRMETIYRLKPNLVWHDRTPLSAEDFAFAWRVYRTPELGVANTQPLNQIEEVTAPDPAIVVIRWSRPNPGAGSLGTREREFPALPRHVLESPFRQDPPDQFAAHPYWSREYLGLGPYFLDRWEPGAFIEGAAFDAHVLGKPRIGRVRIGFISDPNTALANLLAGDVHFSADDSIRFQQGLTLKRQWGSDGGSVLAKPDLWRALYVQLRPELASPAGILDLRVRRALAHAVDRQSLDDGLFEGDGIMADLPFIPATADSYAQVERLAPRYPYDVRRTEALLAEAGFARGADGVYAGPGGRLSFEVKTNASTQNELEVSILASGWRQVGLDAREAVLPAAQAQDAQVRASFPSLYTFSTPLGEDSLAGHISANIPRPENRWVGSNRGGWSSREFDRLSEAFTGTLDSRERAQQVAQMVKLFSEELPALSLFFNPIPVAHVAQLKGPRMVAQDSAIAWDIYLWRF